jgi:Ni/Fe-hydrogenase subunit HybB-like protein
MSTTDQPKPANEGRKGYEADAPVIEGRHTYAEVTEKISGVVLTRYTPRSWFLAFGVGFLLLMIFLVAVTWLLYKGVGVWGINIPVAWGFAITNFVWWIGIGHAGTLISAILLLMRQQWRTSINRFSEAMTLFAVACAGLFPLLHLGRPWLFYWLLPYPNVMGVWPQFRSPLVWDVFAVSTYGTVSLLFWFVGLMPDFATMRDRAEHPALRALYGMLAMGWRGSAAHWRRFETAYLLLAGLATPLVVSVHTVVSFDFAISILPGWHTTIFPPYFVAGAIYSGFAMVLTLVIPIRAIYGLQDLITARHLRNMAKIMLATGIIVAYGYLMEIFISWYSADSYELFVTTNRMAGPYAPVFWSLILCNILIPQLLWSARIRDNTAALFVIAVVINIGMWLERYVIIVTSLHRDYLPSSWGIFSGTIWDYATFAGTIGLFISLMYLFIRGLPMISMFEVRELVSHGQGSGGPDPNANSAPTGEAGH